MARIGARYTHFWAKGKIYRHFWMATEATTQDGNADGATLTVVSSLADGTAGVDASASGDSLVTTSSITGGTATANFEGASETFSENITLIPGAVSASSLVDGVLFTITGTLVGGHADVTSPGALLTITSSLTAGTGSVDGNADGADLEITVTLSEGTYNRIDAEAPIKSRRLNARYRHFWLRGTAERHFWAQFRSNVEPGYQYNPILQVALSLNVPDSPTSGANIDGQTLTVGVELEPGVHSILEPGSLEVVTTVIGGGDPTADAEIDGQTLTINTALIQGWARFDTITVPVTIIPGEVFVPPDAYAFGAVPPPVVITLDPGTVSAGSTLDGETLTVNVELEGGVADVTLDGAQVQVDVELIAGQASGDANVDGATFDVQVYLSEEGVADAGTSTEGDNLTVTTSIIEGVATGEQVEPPSQSARAGGPVGYQRKKPEVSIDAQAHGTVFTMGVGIVEGKPFVEPAIAAPQPIVGDAPKLVHVLGELPEEITKLLQVQPEPVAVHTELAPVSSAVSAEAAVVVVQEPVKKIDWIKYDNDLLELI